MAGSAGSAMSSPGMTGLGNAIGGAVGQGAGTVGTGFQGAMNGAAYYGDSGLASGIGNSAGAYNGALGAINGNSLGSFNATLGGLMPMGSPASGALGGGISGAANGAAGVGGASMGGLSNNAWMYGMAQYPRYTDGVSTAARLASNQQQPAPQAAPVPGGYRRTSAASNGMPIPAALPSMSNPSQSMIPMPGANALPTNSSYGSLLQNMLSNTASNPAAQMIGGQFGPTGVPGYGTSLNPSYIIPGLY
ncbi:hypothetical protein BURMUCF2_A1470 [Burkholderia multivorans CF2]|nr:hypothetical protein BURMUCF2_A1470 [Burkholderia multivorans CF2]